MRDPDAALARRVSRAPLWLRTLSLRRDLALPLVVLAVQLTGAAVSDGSAHVFNPPHALGALGWVLLAAGPVALVARRRYPVPVLWVNVAGTLPWSSAAGLLPAGRHRRGPGQVEAALRAVHPRRAPAGDAQPV